MTDEIKDFKKMTKAELLEIIEKRSKLHKIVVRDYQTLNGDYKKLEDANDARKAKQDKKIEEYKDCMGDLISMINGFELGFCTKRLEWERDHYLPLSDLSETERSKVPPRPMDAAYGFLEAMRRKIIRIGEADVIQLRNNL